MSVGYGLRASTDRRFTAFRLIGPRTWSLWTVSRPFLIYVLVIDIAAVAVFALTATKVAVGSRDLAWFAGLAGASIVHLELMRSTERLRELHAEGNIYTNLKSVWTFAGLLVLPPPLVAALIVVTYTHMWFRVGKKITLHRWVFSACNVALASAAGAVILAAAYPLTYPELPRGLSGFGVVAAAAVARWLVNSALSGAALMLMSPGEMSPRRAFGPGQDDLIEFGSLGLGVLAAALLVYDPAFLLALAIPVVVVHRGLLLHQFEHAAHRDCTTGLHNAGFWHELAGKALERASRLQTTAGLLLIHLDGFKATNDRVAGDLVLRRVADTLRAEVRRDDLVGRLTEDEFVILAPEIAAADLASLVERIRRAVRGLDIDVNGPDGTTTIRGRTVSIGGALYPDNAGTLPELMLVADNAMFAAKTYGHDQARFIASAMKRTIRP